MQSYIQAYLTTGRPPQPGLTSTSFRPLELPKLAEDLHGDDPMDGSRPIMDLGALPREQAFTFVDLAPLYDSTNKTEQMQSISCQHEYSFFSFEVRSYAILAAVSR
jgi:hypothetical protein